MIGTLREGVARADPNKNFARMQKTSEETRLDEENNRRSLRKFMTRERVHQAKVIRPLKIIKISLDAFVIFRQYK